MIILICVVLVFIFCIIVAFVLRRRRHKERLRRGLEYTKKGAKESSTGDGAALWQLDGSDDPTREAYVYARRRDYAMDEDYSETASEPRGPESDEDDVILSPSMLRSRPTGTWARVSGAAAADYEGASSVDSSGTSAAELFQLRVAQLRQQLGKRDDRSRSDSEDDLR